MSEPFRPFETHLDEGAALKLLRRATDGAEDGELFLERRRSEALVFDDGRVKNASYDAAEGFGLRAVNQNGSLAPLDHHTYEPEQLIPAFEAILIEAVEPRQNRKRGDDFSLSEYIQLLDPEIEQREREQLIQELTANLRSPSGRQGA